MRGRHIRTGMSGDYFVVATPGTGIRAVDSCDMLIFVLCEVFAS